jgi:hypothetical protein
MNGHKEPSELLFSWIVNEKYSPMPGWACYDYGTTWRVSGDEAMTTMTE